jgi:hypothetical protein
MRFELRVAERYRRDRPVIEQRSVQRAARQAAGRLEPAVPGDVEIVQFRGIACAREAAGHADDRDGSAPIEPIPPVHPIPPTVHCSLTRNGWLYYPVMSKRCRALRQGE